MPPGKPLKLKNGNVILQRMLVMRFFRVGKKNQPSFKVVVTDKRNPPRAGRFVEEVGFYNPLTKEKVLRKDRIQYWVSQGVKPSPTVYNLLIKEGILEGKKIAVHKKSKKPASLPADLSAVALAKVEASAKAGAETASVKEVVPAVAPAAPAAVVTEPPKEAPKPAPVSEEAKTSKEEASKEEPK